MTTSSLAPSSLMEGTAQYHLPDEDRQAILAQSDSSLLLAEIERMRVEFMRLNVSDGINCTSKD